MVLTNHPGSQLGSFHCLNQFPPLWKDLTLKEYLR